MPFSASLVLWKKLVFIGKTVTQGEDDFPLGLHAAIPPPFHAINGQGGYAGLSRQLSFTHEQPFPYRFDLVRCQFIPPALVLSG
jgi:hypothetical protein